MIDLKRRSFLFGAAATLILPPERTFYILEPPKLIKPQGIMLPKDVKLFDLPTRQSRELGQKLIDGTYKMRDVPRWVVLDQQWYDAMVRQERA